MILIWNSRATCRMFAKVRSLLGCLDCKYKFYETISSSFVKFDTGRLIPWALDVGILSAYKKSIIYHQTKFCCYILIPFKDSIILKVGDRTAVAIHQNAHYISIIPQFGWQHSTIPHNSIYIRCQFVLQLKYVEWAWHFLHSRVIIL